MNKYKSILLLKVPYCKHPDSSVRDEEFRSKSTFRPLPSLALASLCGFIDKYKTYDYELKAVDINIEGYTVPKLPVDITNYLELLTDCVKNSEYDVLALSVMYVFNVRWADVAVKLSKKYHPKAKIIMGGGYPTIFPKRCLKDHNVDDIIIGEGESTLLHILNRYNSYRDAEFENKFPFDGYVSKNAEGEISYVSKKHFINLEDLPQPAWHYLNVEKYFQNSGDRKLPIEASRGCPYECAYCCTYLSWGKRVRYKSVDNLINEIVVLNNKYDWPRLSFVDDNMSFRKEWVVRFLKRLIEMGLALDATASNFSVKHLDEEVIGLLAMAGVKVFGIAVESGSCEIQKRIRKNVNFDKVREIVRIMKFKKLHVHICWMIGFPSETWNQINQTYNFARELGAHSNQFLIVLPYPGTALFEEAKSNNLLLLSDNNLDKFDNRKCDFIKSSEWDFERLQESAYDVNIEVNFLNNPCLAAPEDRKYILGYFEGLLLTLPEHIIMHIVVGYIYKLENNMAACEKHYTTAFELFKSKLLYKTFVKYLSWNYPVIEDFNRYLRNKGISIEIRDSIPAI